MAEYKHSLKKIKSPADILNAPWPAFSSTLHKLEEHQVAGLLKLEMEDRRRESYAMRLFTRMSKLRMERERKELLDQLKCEE